MITLDKIKIFESYSGDIDGFSRGGRDSEQKLFDNNDWSLIDSFYQDIELINKRLAAQTYKEQTIKKLKDNCDIECFDYFTRRIEFYQDFQKIAEILKQIKAFFSKDTDTVWEHFNNADRFLNELSEDIKKIENCDFQALERVNVEFLPTSTYQELSMSTSWGDKYLELSTEFEKIVERMTEIKTAHNSTLSKVVRSWWHKLFGS